MMNIIIMKDIVIMLYIIVKGISFIVVAEIQEKQFIKAFKCFMVIIKEKLI